jgi:uncharacterized membrane protein
MLAVFCFFAISVFKLVLNRLTAGGRRGFLLWAALTVLSGLALAGAFGDANDLIKITFLLPVIINGCFLYLFGRTILPGREPQIARFRRLVGAEPSQAGEHYSKWLTVCWVVFFAVSLGASILLALYADPVTWSFVVNLVLPAVAVIFFLSEHFLRTRYLAHYGAVPLSRTLQIVLRPDAWSTWDMTPRQIDEN